MWHYLVNVRNETHPTANGVRVRVLYILIYLAIEHKCAEKSSPRVHAIITYQSNLFKSLQFFLKKSRIGENLNELYDVITPDRSNTLDSGSQPKFDSLPP